VWWGRWRWRRNYAISSRQFCSGDIQFQPELEQLFQFINKQSIFQ
jgi:hypothetical protein